MKKLLTALILTILFFSQSMAFELKKSDEFEIKSVLNAHNRALKNRDVEKIKTFYSKDYKSADGFDLKDLEAMLEKTFDAYKNIKYTTKVNSVTAFDNIAIAQVSDKTSAILYPSDEVYRKNKDKYGYLNGKSVYNVYLKKNNGNWEIFYDDIVMEETEVKYGIANKINMTLNAPVFIKNGEEYDIMFNMETPEDVIALASLSHEEITYPAKDSDEKFRKFPSSNVLERLVKANKNNLDEYAIASVGFTKVTVNDAIQRARIEVLGMAYIMKRINMEQPKYTPDLKEIVENK